MMSRSKSLSALSTYRTAFLVLVFVQASASAAIINVPSAHATIQGAINAAAMSGDEIIVAPGTYPEFIRFLGKAIYLHSASGDPSDTIIDASGLFTVVVVCASGEGPGTILEGFTITGGGPTFLAGGMLNRRSSPTVINCTFTGNTATLGGGMFNCTRSSPNVVDCMFIGNTGGGGGMLNSRSSAPTVTNCAFVDNSGGGSGTGGMANILFSSPRVTNCIFSGNTGFRAGGMSNGQSCRPRVTNCIFSGNVDTNPATGGGMANGSQSNPTLINCTFSGNTGGIAHRSTGNLTVRNSILWGNIGNQIGFSSSGTAFISYTDIQGGVPAGAVDLGGNIDANPLFTDADGLDNIVGTLDDDLRLLPGSPATDAGNNLLIGITTDLDGLLRFVDISGVPDTGVGPAPIVDMGAYERQVSVSNQPPSISCPLPDNSFTCDDPPQPQATITLTADAEDPDGDPLVVTWEVDSGAGFFIEQMLDAPAGLDFLRVYPLGVHTVRVTVDDGTETATCSTTVTVTDTEDPVAMCASNVSVGTDPGECSAIVTLPAPVVSDDCQVVDLFNDAASLVFGVGTTTVTWTVTDIVGNTATCTQTVTVADVEAPVILECAPDVEVAPDAGECAATVVLGSPVTSDNCVASVDNDAPDPPIFELGTTWVTWTVTDDAGNETSCIQRVTVLDVTAPVVTCLVGDDMLGEDDVLWPPNHSLEVVGLSSDVSDDCDEDPLIEVLVFADEGDEEPTGDGTHSPDAKDIAAGTLRLRKERKGDADGRVYLIVVRATDAFGNVGFSCCTVTVPHSKSASDRAAVQAQAAVAEAECLATATGLAPAGFVVVGDGAVIGPKQ